MNQRKACRALFFFCAAKRQLPHVLPYTMNHITMQGENACMAQGAQAVYEKNFDEGMEQKSAQGLLSGIAQALRVRGTLAQRVLGFLLMALLTPAVLPGGGYACQTAMFAVLLRLGFCVPAAFAGVLLGFGVSFAAGNIMRCWQLVC